MVDYSYYFMTCICFILSYINIQSKEETYIFVFSFVIVLLIFLLSFTSKRSSIENKWKQLK